MIFLFLTLFFGVGCNSSQDSPSGPETNKDSLPKLQPNSKNQVSSEDEITPDLSETIDQYNKYLSEGSGLDTVITLGLDSFNIILKHYSRNDSSISVPTQYVGIYGIEQFVSSAFQSHLIVLKNGKPFINKKIEKKDFNFLLDESLQKFGVLLYPYISICNNKIEIHYSITIPLTDVGVNVKLVLLNDGTLAFSDEISC